MPCQHSLGFGFKSRSDAKENQKTWERQEKTRKEERLFSLKSIAYNNFAKLFALNPMTGIAHFYSDFIAVAIALGNYGSLPVKQEVKTFAASAHGKATRGFWEIPKRALKVFLPYCVHLCCNNYAAHCSISLHFGADSRPWQDGILIGRGCGVYDK